MRLKSSIFVSAILRREQADGAFGAVLRKGSEDAGAIFLVHRISADIATVYAPAPQMFAAESNSADRLFEERLREVEAVEVDGFLDRQISFDPDCWIVEIEKRSPLISIDIADLDGGS
ncbi:DUF1491 family protein [Salaquimonas pukyongi]|uniref:DUF1491 family protein n=1 Tax=Salaquimonas pukyongi TaxID=2712698 RepID=UPI00096B7CA5|nr:DUF1491 family protein [Salaquimonas pukyongi]